MEKHGVLKSFRILLTLTLEIKDNTKELTQLNTAPRPGGPDLGRQQ